MIMRGTSVVGGATFSKAAAARPFCSIEKNKKMMADYDWGHIVSRIDFVAQKVEKIEQQLQKLQPQQPQLDKGEKEQSILEQMGGGGGGGDDYAYGCNFNYTHPVYHDPKLPQFYPLLNGLLIPTIFHRYYITLFP